MKLRHALLCIAMMISGCSLDSPDECPDDPYKDQKGICGCGVSDKDTDGDTIPNCVDTLPDLKNNEDTDGDGIPNIDDPCPLDKSNQCCTDGINGKEEPGFCGCNLEETDSDGDTLPDCVDTCKDDPNKIYIEEDGTLYSVTLKDGKIDKKTETTNICGCGTPDIDTDGDTVPDCIDVCPQDPLKFDTSNKGVCECGVAETDSDNDTVPDCIDVCDENENIQTEEQRDANACGCDKECVPCPADALFEIKGVCGCYIQAVTEGENKNTGDSDNDSIIDCFDICPNNPLVKDSLESIENLEEYYASEAYGKILARCHLADADEDGLLDDEDPCPTNPDKTATEETCNVYNTTSHIFTIRHALDFATLKKVLAENTTNATWTVNVEKDINLAYAYLDIDNIEGSKIQITDESCHVISPAISLNNVHFIGNGHNINAVYKDRECALDNALFESIQASEVKNLKLHFNADSDARGLLANDVTGNSKIQDISVKGKVTSNANDLPVGGMIGQISGQILNEANSTYFDIANCYADGISVEAPNASATGGLIGTMQNAIINLPTTKNTVISVSGKDNVGGLFGLISSSTLNSGQIQYHLSQINPPTEGFINNQVTSISGKDNVGGLVGSYQCGVVNCPINLKNIHNQVTTITSTGNYIGGLAGKLTGYASSINMISNNVDKIETTGQYAAGFIAYYTVTNNDTFSFIKNTANFVKSSRFAAGLITEFYPGSTIKIEKIQNIAKYVESVSEPAGLISVCELSDINLINFYNISSFANVNVHAPEAYSPGYKPNIGGLFSKVTSPSNEKLTLGIHNVITAAALFHISNDEVKSQLNKPYVTDNIENLNNPTGAISNFKWFKFGLTETEEAYDTGSGPGHSDSAYSFTADNTTDLLRTLNSSTDTDSSISWAAGSFKFDSLSSDTSLPMLALPGLSSAE